MENWMNISPWGASGATPLPVRERALAPISAVQGTGLSAAGYGGAQKAFGFGFQPASAPQHATTGTPVMTVIAAPSTDVDVRVPPRGRPL